MEDLDAQTENGPLLFIDQLCIDQKNIKERNHQVHSMARIYSAAELVIVWLGKSDQASESVFNFIKEWQRSPSLDIRNRMKEQGRHLLLYLEAQVYWTRVWIVQEIVLARKVALWWGSATIELEVLREVVYSFWSFEIFVKADFLRPKARNREQLSPRTAEQPSFRDFMEEPVPNDEQLDSHNIEQKVHQIDERPSQADDESGQRPSPSSIQRRDARDVQRPEGPIACEPIPEEPSSNGSEHSDDRQSENQLGGLAKQQNPLPLISSVLKARDRCAGGFYLDWDTLTTMLRGRHCENPRDKVYALLGMTRAGRKWPGLDYSKSVEEVFHDLLQHGLVEACFGKTIYLSTAKIWRDEMGLNGRVSISHEIWEKLHAVAGSPPAPNSEWKTKQDECFAGKGERSIKLAYETEKSSSHGSSRSRRRSKRSLLRCQASWRRKVGSFRRHLRDLHLPF